MSGILDGKVAIITGGAGGIGSRIAQTYVEAGARVVIASRSQEKIDAVVEQLSAAGGEAVAVATDVTVPEDVTTMVAKTIEAFGRVDVLVNNAGGAMFVKPPEKLRPEEWNAAIALKDDWVLSSDPLNTNTALLREERDLAMRPGDQ